MNNVRPAGVTKRFEIRVEEKTHIGTDGTPVPAILDFVLGVKPDSMTVLMGPSGCGETTLLRIIAHLDDRFVGDAGVPETARLGFMFQEPRLLPWRTVQQNIELVAPPGFSETDLHQLATAVEIADMLPRYPQERRRPSPDVMLSAITTNAATSAVTFNLAPNMIGQATPQMHSA